MAFLKTAKPATARRDEPAPNVEQLGGPLDEKVTENLPCLQERLPRRRPVPRAQAAANGQVGERRRNANFVWRSIAQIVASWLAMTDLLFAEARR
jgi:hypothetical protein